MLFGYALDKLQEKRWENLQIALLKSPFYHDITIKNEIFSQYPVMNKSIFMKYFNSINTKEIDYKEAWDIALKAEKTRDFTPMKDNVTIGLSSGTSGNRGIFLASESERLLWVSCILDRVIGFSIKKRSVAFFLRANSNLYNSVQSKFLQFEFFDLLQPLEEQLDRLNNLNPSILVAQPILLLELAHKLEEGLVRIKPLKIISVAEVLYPEDKQYLERVFGQIIHQVYQCTEGLLATTCKYGTLHFNEDFLIIEKKYIDKDLTRFHPIITDLLRTTQPIIRYELNDIIHEKKDCLCGSKWLAIEKIEGRSDDMLHFYDNEEIKIFPDFFRRAILMSSDKIKDYTLLQTDSKLLELYIDPLSDFKLAKNSIISLLKKYGVHNVSVIRVKKKHHERGNKLRRIRNGCKN